MPAEDFVATILLVEDHKPLAETVILYLENAGYTLDYSADGLSALHLATTNQYDAIVLDILLPGINGFEICHKLRAEALISTPILMLTARDQLEDKLRGFQNGADDYLVKPFDLPELDVRLQALIRRQRGELEQQTLQVGDLILNPRSMTATRQGRDLPLKPTGFRILKILMRESPAMVKREALERELWGDMIPDSDALRSHIYQLRKAIDKPFAQPMIQTYPGVGVKLVTPAT
ncbi:response regulator transcription factor [Ketobacter sp. MCCC 1A13808]|uniref:response regulator transcription factor n=1 Tax=Ketobacter sp. MCCC 1A13808 TaxID=2602738 RepID=UPI000F2BBF91|nr:response regulator transcription factor [Ketobacter sp. MCCC 1A13808]MVF13223.1 response regulator transcription factor [Ketobacter sp. MCCC 1A13808]RLP54219.1 MAG: DNA-binding response regulator [Ketobacter sp.]